MARPRPSIVRRWLCFDPPAPGRQMREPAEEPPTAAAPAASECRALPEPGRFSRAYNPTRRAGLDPADGEINGREAPLPPRDRFPKPIRLRREAARSARIPDPVSRLYSAMLPPPESHRASTSTAL